MTDRIAHFGQRLADLFSWPRWLRRLWLLTLPLSFVLQMALMALTFILWATVSFVEALIEVWSRK